MMRKITRRDLLLAGAVLSAAGSCKAIPLLNVSSYPEGSESRKNGGQTGYYPLWKEGSTVPVDLMLIYQGGVGRPQWTVDRFAPYVTYSDPQTGKEQWLLDGFLIIEFTDFMGNTYQPDSKRKPARKESWLKLLERNFAANDGVPMLEEACRNARQRIGPPRRRRRVVLTLPVPIVGQTDWGELDGRALDFHKSADRLAACRWYVDAAMEKWRALAPKEIDLVGFYWVQEEGPMTEEERSFLRAVAQIVHAQKKQYYWIPYWLHPQVQSAWHSFGFDAAYQQPNYFFRPDVPGSRLQEACDFAGRSGMGLEMEFDERVITKPEIFRPRLEAYLDSFTQNGVRDGSAMGWYDGGGALFQLATSKDPDVRRLYDRISQFVLTRQHLADRSFRPHAEE
jgi:hypothetical protein